MIDPMQVDSKGYQLYDLGHDWQIKSSRKTFTGTLKQVCTYAVLELGFSMNELEVAIMEMHKEFHNAAEFGMYRTFIYTFDKEEIYGKTGTSN